MSDPARGFKVCVRKRGGGLSGKGEGAGSCDRDGASVQDPRETGNSSPQSHSYPQYSPRRGTLGAPAQPLTRMRTAFAPPRQGTHSLPLPPDPGFLWKPLPTSHQARTPSLSALAPVIVPPPNPVDLCEMLFKCLSVSFRSHSSTDFGKCVCLTTL